MKNKKKEPPIVACLIILYTCSFGLSLFNRGIYWDDWNHLKGKKIVEIFKEQGNIWAGHFYKFLLSPDKRREK